MFKKILLPVDHSGRHAPALEAVMCFEREGDDVEAIVLHVIEEIAGASRDEEGSFYERLEQVAHERMSPIVEALRARGVAARAEVRYGERARGIVEFAAGEGVDLIIVSSHRVEPDAMGPGWNTVSYAVAVFAQCPVLLVK